MVLEQTRISFTQISMKAVVGNKYRHISHSNMQYPLAEIKFKKHVSDAKFARQSVLSDTRAIVSLSAAHICVGPAV